MPQISFSAMGCHMLALLDAEGDMARQALAKVPGWFATWEQRLSRFRPDSELMMLNARAGRQTPVSPVLWSAIRAALVAARLSGGLVVPTLLSALVAAGYDRSFEQIGRRAGTEASDHQQVACEPPTGDWRAIRLDRRRRAVTLPPGGLLDLGGSAKGWAAERAARRLSVYGPALVDAGGDIAISGLRADGSPWPIGVANPALPDDDLAQLWLPRCGVATSGRDQRRWRRADGWQHHILDPRTGQPADSDVLSATVVAPDAVEAESAAKTAVILGSAAARCWLEARPHLAGLLVLEQGDIVMTQRMAHYQIEQADYAFEYHPP